MQPPYYTDEGKRSFIIFCCGFLFPPVWLASIKYRGSHKRDAYDWYSWSISFFMLFVLLIVIAAHSVAIYYGHVYDDPIVVQGTKAVKELELHLGDYVAIAWGVLMCIVLLWEVLTDNTCFRRLKFKIGNEIRKRKYAQPQ